MPAIDHLILNVNEIAPSVDFYVDVLGFTFEGEDGPFTVIRVSDDFTLQLPGARGETSITPLLSRKMHFTRCFVR